MTLKRPEPDTSPSGVFGEKQWKIVPLLPTQEMIDAWRLDQAQLRSLETSYKAMIDAAPLAPDPRDALIKELIGALVAAQVAMSDGGIPSTPFVTDALSKIDVTLSKAKGVVDG